MERLVRVRRVQEFFRSTVLISYQGRCAITGLEVPALLNASHIIPWTESEARRADPRNGICLNALHDRAFDRRLIGSDNDLRVIVSPVLSKRELGALDAELAGVAWRRLRLPERFGPDLDAIAHHRAYSGTNSADRWRHGVHRAIVWIVTQAPLAARSVSQLPSSSRA